MSDDDLLTARDVEALTGVSASTLNEWAASREAGRSGPGPVHLKLSPRHRRWRRGDVEAWLAAARVDGK